jgi:predicted nucleotidyltransferase
MFNPFLSSFVSARDQLLEQIVAFLKQDERFVAAWLAGSFGRGEQDEISDLDLHVVVADIYSERLCNRPWPHGARTTEDRLALFRQFGAPSVVYDAHENAPEGGTFTYVLYQESALNVDWILLSQATAAREEQSLLLFDKVGIPMAAPPETVSVEQRGQVAAVQAGLFWVMTPIAIKYMLREEPVVFQDMLETLHGLLREAAGSVAGMALPYQSRALAPLYITQEQRAKAVRELCDKMLQLMPEIERMGGHVYSAPMAVVDIWLAMDEHPALQERYAAQRAAWLARVVEAIKADERFVAAWLDGSYARGEQDLLSDLDLRIVVAPPFSESLCTVSWDGAQPMAAEIRLDFVRQFGDPGIVWESKSWVGDQSSFTLTFYNDTGLHVDWVLLPQEKARRGRDSLLLFDKAGVPVETPPEAESLEERAISASDIVGFFWMIAASNLKNLMRGDLVNFHLLLDWLSNGLRKTQAILQGEPFIERREGKLFLTREEQLAALRTLCERMLALMPEVTRIGGYVPDKPMAVIEQRIAIAEAR